MSSTLIENLNDVENFELKIIDEENLPEYILDLSLNKTIRLEALEKYFVLNEDNAIEILSRLSGMYQFSGSKIIRQFLLTICEVGKVSSFLKLESAKSLLFFEEATEGSDSEDDKELAEIKRESDLLITKRNKDRKEEAYRALNIVCECIENIATPCRIEAVCMLMESEDYMSESDIYFRNIINDQNIDCNFRYKTILSLENKNIHEPEFFLKSACIDFLTNVGNMTMYRILASQYVLQKFSPSELVKEMIEQTLLGFGYEDDLDYNLRADAADTLLSLGSEESKSKAREIIYSLGRVDGCNKTVFDNAQNVHTDAIEESVLEVLEFFSTIPLLEVESEDKEYKTHIYFEYVCNKIHEILSKKECDKCKNKKEDETYCNIECLNMFEKHKSVYIALDRIGMDRVVYSKFNNTLTNILLKVWTYLTDHENEGEMKERLFEELSEMAGTCSTGFASRLVNVISGFGQFNIRISWEDQVVGNFTGRLNECARKISDTDSPYFKSKLKDVVKLWLNSNKKIKNCVIQKITKSKKLTDQPNMNQIVEKYLEEDREIKVSVCVEDFSMTVLNEMMLQASEFQSRQCFLLFFRTSMPAIREEMYNEFKDYITDVDFDLYFRKSIYVYEGN